MGEHLLPEIQAGPRQQDRESKRVSGSEQPFLKHVSDVFEGCQQERLALFWTGSDDNTYYLYRQESVFRGPREAPGNTLKKAVLPSRCLTLNSDRFEPSFGL